MTRLGQIARRSATIASSRRTPKLIGIADASGRSQTRVRNVMWRDADPTGRSFEEFVLGCYAL